MSQLLRSRGFVVTVHLLLWLLLYLAVRSIRTPAPLYRADNGLSTQAQSPVPVAGLDQLLLASNWQHALSTNNLVSPFFTRHFIPDTAPTAPPPTTRKIAVTYQGFFETATGPKRTIVKVGDAFVVTNVGALITANLYAAAANMKELTITNSAAKTNLLPLNTMQEIEVPIH